MIEIIDRNYVIAFGQRINRPHGTGVKHWLEFWERRQFLTAKADPSAKVIRFTSDKVEPYA